MQSSLNLPINHQRDSSRTAADKSRIYAFVRTDITLAQQGVQSAHAAAEAGARFYEPTKHGVASLILLQISDLRALGKAQDALAVAGIDFTTFYEPDQDATRAPGTPMGLSAIGTRPMLPSEWAFFRRWRLWDGIKQGLALPRGLREEMAVSL